MKKHAAIFMIFYLTEGRSLKRSREERLQRNRRNLHKKEHKAMNVEVSASLRTNWKPENVREFYSTNLLFFYFEDSDFFRIVDQDRRIYSTRHRQKGEDKIRSWSKIVIFTKIQSIFPITTVRQNVRKTLENFVTSIVNKNINFAHSLDV